MDAEEELARWRRLLESGEVPGDDDMLLLALLPLTHLTRPVVEMLPEAQAAFAAVPDDVRLALFRVTVALSYNQTDVADRGRLREVLGTMPLGQEYLQELERENREAEARGLRNGIAQTEARLKAETEARIAEIEATMREEVRAAIVDMYVTRYRGSPALVQDALGRITDRQRLLRILRDLALAPDAAVAHRLLGLDL